MKKFYKGFLTLGLLFLVSGCVVQDTLKSIDNKLFKPLADSISTPEEVFSKKETSEELSKKLDDNNFINNLKKQGLFDDKSCRIKVYNKTIHIKKQIVDYYHPQSQNAVDYYLTLDNLNDKIAMAFKQTAKERGNIVKIYKNKVNQAILKFTVGISQPHDRYSKNISNLDFSMIEYDKNGNKVSVFIRSLLVEQSSLNELKNLYQNTYVIPKSKIILMEMNINNNVFTSNLYKILYDNSEKHTTNSSTDTEEKLKQLKLLYSDGIITQDEYKQESLKLIHK